MAEFGFDPRKAIRHLKAADPVLGAVMAGVPFGMQLKSSRSLFGALAEAIVYQQLSNKAAATIYSRVEALFPRARNGFTPMHILGATDEALRGCGLSRAKVLAVQDLARRVQAGELPTIEAAQALADEDLIESLVKVRGIGRWSAEMFLITHLGRADVLPVDDFGLRRGFQRTFRTTGVPSPSAVARRGERWRPFRTVATWYLWRSLEL